MRTYSLALLTAGVIGLGFIGPGAGSAMAELTASEKAFVMKAASDGLAEMQLGQIAQQKATSSRVRQLGSRMVADNTQAMQDLQQIAETESLELPTEPEKLSLSTAQRLRGTTGTGFDEAYLQQTVRDQQRIVAEYRRQAKSAKDPAVQSFAQKFLPLVQQHLLLAQSLNVPTNDRQ
jgi:putative membrane protein